MAPGGEGRQSLEALARAVETAFNVRVTALVPIRSAYQVVSPQGRFCLREVNTEAWPKLAFLRDITDYLWERGFARVPRFLPTRFGEVAWPFGSRRCSLTTWLPGEECWLERRQNLEAAAAGLAGLHRASVGFPLRPAHAPAIRWGTWPEELAEGARFLSGAVRRAAAAPHPSGLDRWLLENAGWLGERIAGARTALTEIGLPAGQWGSGVFCHNSLYYQNILIDAARTTYFVDLDRAVWDHRMRDLAHFLDRYLHRVGWRAGCAKVALDAYRRVWPLTPLDRRLLYVRLLYPERFLKRLRSHYGLRAKEVGRAAARVAYLARNGRRRAAFLAGLACWVEDGRPPR